MTAQTFREPTVVPPSLPPSRTVRRDGGEGRILRIALACAILIHALLLLLPVRWGDRPVAGEKIRGGLEVTKAVIPPPRIDPPAPRESREVPVRVPLPAADPTVEELEPLPERSSFADEPVEAVPWEGLPVEDVPPPRRPVLVPGTAGLTLPERLPGGAEPAYPRAAREAGIGGQVIVQAIIDEEGYVEEISVVRAPRIDLGFSGAAVEAVSSWRYRPGNMYGRPVAVRLTVVVDFGLPR
jgi:protein TonB